MAKTITERYCPARQLPEKMTEAAARRQGWEWAVDRDGKKWFCPACAARRRGVTGAGPCKSSPPQTSGLVDSEKSLGQRHERDMIPEDDSKKTDQEPLERKAKRAPVGQRVHRRRMLARQRRQAISDAVSK